MEEPPADVPGVTDAQLARALAAMRQWPDSEETPEAFLDRHRDLRAVLEPMLLGTGPPASALAGETLFGERFRIVSLLGRGGMGSVYEAFDTKLRRLVALKVLRAALQLEGQALARFRREAELMARLHHENIVRVHEIGEADGSPFLVMERIDGVPLSRLVGALASRPRPPTIAELSQQLDAHASAGNATPPQALPVRVLATDYER